ncbi:YbdK family carboxylate-amine ligase [Microbacterium sp. NPDC089321]|uniref:carboxylate-amine ligase n=1 Tax=Microbacterium sp. NPDC089321 TaxID=3155183 RepID=UPI0034250F50
MDATRFGIEEEFLLLDASALVPLSGSGIVERVKGPAPGGGMITSEYLTCQFECATDPVRTLAEAGEQLGGMRRMLASLAPENAIVAATGAPLAQWGAPLISASKHYDDVQSLLGQLTRQHAVNGLHVHVEVFGDEERVRALRRVRAWLPVLLALSANSPFTYGVASGLASWRSVLIRRLPVSWAPPAFCDADEYHRTVEQLVTVGLLPSRGSTSWAVRLSERFDTVEVRVADAQLRVDDALLLTSLMRAIVVSVDLPDAAPPAAELDAALWLAARHGMDARLFTPDGEIEDAWTATERMLEGIRDALDQLGDAAFVDEHLGRIRSEGTGSERQLRAYESGGAQALGDLYRDW